MPAEEKEREKEHETTIECTTAHTVHYSTNLPI